MSSPDSFKETPRSKHTAYEGLNIQYNKNTEFQVMKKSRKEKKSARVKEKKRQTEGPRAAAVCGRIRVASGEGGLLRRNEALMDKGD